jgi:selenide,water dikinase
VGFPDDELDLSILGEILRGSLERVAEAGAVMVGGHTVRDAEIKFGLSVTGLVPPQEVLTNAGGRVGDDLVLTKPLGTGFVTTAAKRQNCPDEVLQHAIDSMIQLNVIGRDALRAAGGAHAVTDITGFGLAGHASEMAEGSALTLVLETHSFPLIEGSRSVAQPRYFTRASRSNREFLDGRLRIEPQADPIALEYAFDAQTSGGLLIAVSPDHTAQLVEELRSRGAMASVVVGRVVQRQGPIALVLK